MYTIICAGGSGVRVLEAVVQLCAAGLGPDSLRILVIDPDKSNGNYSRVKILVDKYVQCAADYGGKLGGNLRLFGTNIDLLDAEGSEYGIKVWAPVEPGKNLKDLVNYDTIPAVQAEAPKGEASAPTSRDVVHLFYTDDELKEKLGQGFRGHPSIGAAAMALLSLHADTPPWAQLVGKIKIDVGQPSGSRVFLVGSVFGGTGASALHPVARFLRSVLKTNKERLKIGVAALVPYFQFIRKEGDADDHNAPNLVAQAEWFPLATKAAVEYYQHLRENDDWPFDTVYWVGDSGQMKLEFKPGGMEQKNPAHFVDLLAAFAALDFFGTPVNDLPTGGASLYTGPRQSDIPLAPAEKNVVDWGDLPRVAGKTPEKLRTSLLTFLLAGSVHLRFGLPLLESPNLDSNAHCVPWYFQRFRPPNGSLKTEAEMKKLKHLAEFFRLCHFVWWQQVLSLEDSSDVRLLSRAAMQADGAAVEFDLLHLADILWSEKQGALKPDPMDAFFTDMVRVPRNEGVAQGSEAYVALLANAAERFIEREYKGNLAKER